MSRNPPASLNVDDTPQLVILTFDSAITKNELPFYTEIIDNQGFLNPNGCPISMTFFINHENNDYSMTNSLYNKGQEIGTHSLSHTIPANFWGTYNLSTWKAEVGGMTYAAYYYGNFPPAAIQGQKCPFLQCNGDVTLDAMQAKGVKYDVSFPTVVYVDPPIWPYTMDFGLQHDCALPPCPTQGHPGIWTFPLITLKDQYDDVCTQLECSRPANEQETFDYLKMNFDRHFNSNRAPFILSQTATAWFNSAPYIFPGFLRFLQYVNNLEQVYIVSVAKAYEWVKNPQPLATAGNPGGPLACPGQATQSCQLKTCSYDEASGEPGGSGLRGGGKFVTCSRNCPDRYPWTCNPQGFDPRPDVCDEGV